MIASVFIATSLDGYIARTNGDLDWLPAVNPDDAEDFGFKAFMADIDALVMGRRSFEKVLTFGSWPYADKPVIVLATNLKCLPSPPAPTVEYMTGSPQEIVMQLSARGIKRIYVDGGITIQRFLAAGLIQRMIVTRVPVILGSGIPLFGPLAGGIKLNHVSTRSYQNGLVQSEYAIAG